MAEGGSGRWRFSPSTWCLAGGVAVAALYFLLPGGAWGKSAVVASLPVCMLSVWAGARIERRRLEERVRHQAMYDPLTDSESDPVPRPHGACRLRLSAAGPPRG